MNVSFKIYWNNPIEMQPESGTQQLTLEVPLGAIINDVSGVGNLSNYYTKPETDVKIQDTIDYVDGENSSQDTIISQNNTDSINRDNTLNTSIGNTNNIVVQNKTTQDAKNILLDVEDANLQLQITTNDTASQNRDTALDQRIDDTNTTVAQNKADQLIKDTAQDNLIALKANASYVDTQNNAQDLSISLKANKTYVDSEIIGAKSYADGKVQQTITDGVTDSAPSQNALYDALLVKQNLPTGYVQGWELSVDPANNTKFRISAGTGVFTDFSNVLNIHPVIKETTTMLSGLTPQFLATHPSSYIAFDINLGLVQSSSPFTNEDRRTLVLLGSIIHSNNIVVNVVNEIKAPIVAATNQLHDFILAVGALNLNGNEILTNGNNLSINVNAGTIWKLGINASNMFNPHILNIPLRIAPQFAYRLRNSIQYTPTTFLEPTHYDLNGVRTLLTNNNRWSIQRLYMFQSGVIVALYGQAEYTSYQNALNSVLSEPFDTEKNCKENGILIGRIILRKTCTDLIADMQNGTASIHLADKFGSTSSTASVTAQAIINSLGYVPVNPRKTVDTRTNNYTLQTQNAGNIVRTTGNTASNITVPTEASQGWIAQDRIEVEWFGTGQPTIVAASGVTIRVAGGGSLALTQQYSRVLLEYIGSNEWVMYR